MSWPPGAGVVADDDLDRLPLPVRRYLRVAGVIGRQMPREVTIGQVGRIRSSPTSRWRAITARQTFSTDPPGFTWSARARVIPPLAVSVTDGYRNGRGQLEVHAPPGIKLSSAEGSDVDRAALMRFLAELVWVPAAMLAPYVRWHELDRHSARATIADAELEVSADFYFGDDGLVQRITAERTKDAGTSKAALWPWVALVSDYGRGAGGVLVPGRAEVRWLLPDGAFGYFEAEVSEVETTPPVGPPTAAGSLTASNPSK